MRLIPCRCLPLMSVVVMVLFWLSGSTMVPAQNQVVQVYIMAGQSNMEGKGSVVTLQKQLANEKTAVRYHGLTRDGEFYSRDDVFISYRGAAGTRSGPLELGYGTSRPDDKRLFGPELGFGWMLGDQSDAPVLIIKTAWGGKSIDRDFRPPSRKFPDSIDVYFKQKQSKNPSYTRQQCEEEYGRFYRLMIEHIRVVMNEPGDGVPKNSRLQLSGFIWFQGFNDQFAPTSVEDYEDNMVAFIQDVRKDLNSPKLPFVIGAMGHGGENQKGKVQQIAQAQRDAALRFTDGTVKTVATAKFWDTEADDAFRKYWQDEPNRDIEKWRFYGNDRPYHYHGSPKFFWEVGQAFATAMMELSNSDH